MDTNEFAIILPQDTEQPVRIVEVAPSRRPFYMRAADLLGSDYIEPVHPESLRDHDLLVLVDEEGLFVSTNHVNPRTERLGWPTVGDAIVVAEVKHDYDSYDISWLGRGQADKALETIKSLLGELA